MMPLLNVAIFSLVLLGAIELPLVGAIQCYSGTTLSSSPIPAEDLKIIACNSAAAFCFKQQTIETVVNGSETSSRIFRWGCYEGDLAIKDYYKCGDLIEVTVATRITGPTDYSYIYSHACTCCGDLCNNENITGYCDWPQVATIRCYTYVGTKDPSLPTAKALSIPVTREQSCYKISRMKGGVADYEWGAANVLRGVCGNGFTAPDAKMCTCCGSYCNGPQMDPITVDTTCDPPPVTTVTTTQPAPTTTPSTPPPTTQQPLSCSFDGLYAGIGVLAGLLFIAILVIGYLIYRLKNASSPTNQMRMVIQDDS